LKVNTLFWLPAHLNDQRISIINDFSGPCTQAIHACPLLLKDQEEKKRSCHGHACIGSLPFSKKQTFLRVIPIQIYRRKGPVFVVIRIPLILIEPESSILPLVNTQQERGVPSGFRSRLDIRAKGDNGSRAYEQGKDL